MVQQFVDTGETITCYRVLTLFGEPLYFQFNRLADPRVDLNAADEVIERAPIANQSFTDKKRLLITEPDVLALARRAHEAIPEVPLKGVDILREIRHRQALRDRGETAAATPGISPRRIWRRPARKRGRRSSATSAASSMPCAPLPASWSRRPTPRRNKPGALAPDAGEELLEVWRQVATLGIRMRPWPSPLDGRQQVIFRVAPAAR
ncbi:MAG: hypothetical protein WDM84_08975 [Bauldia sp.]